MNKTASGPSTRRSHSAALKAIVALAALREDKTMADLCKEFELHPTQTNEWKRQLLDRAADVFSAGLAPEPVDLAPLHAKTGQSALENVFFEGAPIKTGLLSAKR